jgi:hypothetical protein
MPQLANRYPETAPPIWKQNKAGDWYLAKQYSQEEQDLQLLRRSIQKDLDAGNYTPFFDPAERFHVDGRNYDRPFDTRNIRPVNAATQARHEARARSPEATERLDNAYALGREHEQDARDWFAMGQVEKAYINELGEEEGRRQFKKSLADAMAATTAGADPRANLMLAHYANFLEANGLPVPTNSYDFPYSVGSRYASSNMKQYRRMISEGQGITPANPKRYDFRNSFLGQTGDRPPPIGDNSKYFPEESGFDSGPPIDEQRYRLMDPERSAPTRGSYGHYKGAVVDRAEANGVSPSYYGDMIYAGARQGHRTKPMITVFNEMIERVHRITGMPRSEVLRGYIRKTIPIFGLGGVAAGNGLATEDDDDQVER